MKSMVIKLLLFFYFTSSYLGVTHIHFDSLDSLDHCKVHILIKNLNSGDTPDDPFELLGCLGCFETISFYTSHVIQALSKGFDAQAPPSFS